MATVMAVHIARAGGSSLSVSLVFAVFYLGWTVCAPIWGALADATGRRREVLLAASAFATLTSLALTLVRGVWPPLVVRAVYALFAAAYLPILLTMVSERGGPEARGRAIGVFSSAQGVGFAAAQASAGLLLGLLVPWRLYLVVTAVTAVVFLATLVIDDPAPTPNETPSLTALGHDIKRRLLPAKGGREHLRQNGLGWLYFALILRNATVMGTSSLLPVYLVDRLGVTEATMGLLLAINPAGQIGFMYLAGGLADRLGRKPLITLGITGSGLYPALMAVAGFSASLPRRIAVAALGFLTLALAFSGLRVGTISFIGDVAPMNRESELIGLRSTARGLGGVLGPVVVGAVAAVATYETTFFLASLAAFAGATVVAFTLVESLSTGTVAGAD